MATETTNPNPIGTKLEQALSRMQALASSTSEQAPKVAEPSPADFGPKLIERGFPRRHVDRLREPLTGPGFDKAQSLLHRIIKGDCLLMLIGDRGPGKTQMATWWALERMKAGLFVGWYRKTADIISEIKRTWGDGGKSIGTEDDILKKYRKASYLVLDEFHERGSSDWEARTLINILDHRYDNMLATVLIANMSEAQVRSDINPSIVSRAEETGGLVICDWPSYRRA